MLLRFLLETNTVKTNILHHDLPLNLSIFILALALIREDRKHKTRRAAQWVGVNRATH